MADQGVKDPGKLFQSAFLYNNLWTFARIIHLILIINYFPPLWELKMARMQQIRAFFVQNKIKK